MRVLTRLFLAVALITAASACKHNKRANTTVRHRAEFDMSCPRDDLRLIVLDTEGARKLSSLIAVEGCGQKAVYAFYPDANTWLIDGVVTPMEEGFEPPTDAASDKRRSDKRAAKAERKGNMSSEAAEPEPAKEKKKRRKDD